MHQNDAMARTLWLPSTVGGATGNQAVTDMWKKHFTALLNSSKNCEIGNFVKQSINSQENFDGIDDWMCNSYKIKSLLHKLTLNRVAGKDGILAERIFMLIQVCAVTWVVCSTCGVARRGQRGHSPQIFGIYTVVILCFERRYPKKIAFFA